MEEKGEEEINHSKGRRKIEIKKIDVESKRQVTFSKRRAGLFKKASEISILCGVQAAVIVVSPKERVFTSGHPNVDTVVNQFVKYYGDDKEEMDFNNMKKCLEEIKILEEKRRSEEVKLVGHEKRKDSFWWSKDVDRMGLEELENFVEALEELKENVKKKIGNGG